MNKKYLFGMLLSGALLAACTAEDDLKAPVAQQVNPDAPVFTVAFENNGDLQNRAAYEGNNLKFVDSDKLSLFHGAYASLYGWQNAIYQGHEEDGKMVFVTQAMVNAGHAVMVYPADTTFSQPGYGEDNNVGYALPLVSVSPTQTPATKLSTPYVSEVLELARELEDDDYRAEAGWRKDYDIVMRRAAGTLTLNMQTSNAPSIEGVDPIKVTSVVLKSGNNSFSKDAWVTAVDIEEGKEYEDYPSWVKTTVVTSNTPTNALTTTDLDGNKSATFTVLPLSTAALEDCSIEVHTTYGVVYLTEESGKIWVENTLKDDNVTVGLGKVLPALYGAATSGRFKGKQVGKVSAPTIKVDFSKLKLDGMHITTSEELETVLKVYDALSKNQSNEQKVTLYLDGTKGLFTMEDAAWKAVAEHMANLEYDEDNNWVKGVKFVACNDHACTKVQLNHTGDATPVPSLTFENSGKTVDVNLKGKWLFDGNLYDDPTTKTTVETINFNKVNQLEVLSGAEITLKNEIKANANVKVKISGTANVSGTVYLGLNLDNYGTINIGANDKLGLTDGVTLVNMEAQGSSNKGWDKGAVIDNSGWLGITGNNGIINNYGIIESRVGARTYITTNSRKADKEAITSAFVKGSSAIGTINIYEPLLKSTNNVRVLNNQGFIKLTVNETNAKYAQFGDVANYVVLGGSCAGVTYNRTGEGTDTKPYVYSNLPGTVKYVEIQSSKEVVFTGDFTLEGLIVKANTSINIPENSKITLGSRTEENLEGTTGYVYLKGIASRAGTFDPSDAQFSGYFTDGNKNDKKNIWSYN